MDWGPRSSIGKCNRQYPMTSPQYVFPTTLGLALEGLSPLPFHTATLCLAPVLEGGLR
jgi:hypothetical protein